MNLLISTSDQNELKRTGCTLLPKKKKNWNSSCQDTGHWSRDGKQKRGALWLH